MQILLINKNPIVSKLFLLSAKDIEGLEIDEVEDIKHLPQESYDILFIDDGDSTNDELEEYIYSIGAKQKILFVSDDNRFINGVDEIIKKPFLPSTIISILHSSYDEERVAIEENNNNGPILDRAEIDTIKRLLLDSEDEIDAQVDIIEEDSAEAEERLIKVLMDMKPKMIKKLLKGAEINITIKFPKEEM
jgi:hypothetical protein